MYRKRARSFVGKQKKRSCASYTTVVSAVSATTRHDRRVPNHFRPFNRLRMITIATAPLSCTVSKLSSCYLPKLRGHVTPNNPSSGVICETRTVQPVTTCRQSPYLRKPAIVIVTSFSLWRLALAALAAPVLVMTSFFSLWRHSLLSWPRPPLQTADVSR